MSNGHVRRTKTSAAAIVSSRTRRLWLAAVAIPVVAVAPAYFYFPSAPQADEIEAIITEVGFQPLIPPNRLRGPGALYAVVDGRFYEKVCDAEGALLAGKLNKSPAPNHHRKRLERGGLSLGGDYMEMLKGKLSAHRVASVDFRLTDVAISEITLSDLVDIEDNLLRRKSCDQIVQSLLKANKQVCSGYAALSATTSIKVTFDSSFESDAQGKVQALHAVKRTLEENADGQFNIKSTDEIHGDNLFYGIKLSPRCITFETANQPSVLPETPARGEAGAPGRV